MLLLLDKILLTEMNLKNLITRTLSGAVYVALIVLGIMTVEWAFVAFCALFTLLATREFILMTKPGGSKINLSIDIAFAVGLVLLFTIASTQAVKGLDPSVSILLILPYMLVRLISQLYNKEENPIKSIAYSVFSQCYIVIPMMLMPMLLDISNTFLLLIFVMIWMNDTGAFLVGCTIGKHRLFERISPKKSWEGFWGGMFFCVMTGVGYYYLIPEVPATINSLPFFIILGIIVSVFATFGDLVESMFKRSVGVKDSGNLIPGHGGILDRIDSLLFVIPAVAFYLVIQFLFA